MRDHERQRARETREEIEQEKKHQAMDDFENHIVADADESELMEMLDDLERKADKTQHEIAKLNQKLDRAKDRKSHITWKMGVVEDELKERQR